MEQKNIIFKAPIEIEFALKEKLIFNLLSK